MRPDPSDRAVIVFDSDHRNPYGLELAHLLAAEYAVTVVCSPEGSFRPPGAWLPLRRAGAGPVRVALVELVTLLRVAWRACRGVPVVVVWARTAQRVVLAMIAQLCRRATVVVIAHNVGSGRDPEGLSARVDARLRRRARTVVHGRALADAAVAAGATEVIAVRHVPYRAYWGQLRPESCAAEGDGERFDLLVLGALRPDKCTEGELLELVDRIGRAGFPTRLVACVRPRVELPARVGAVEVVNVSADFVPDDVVADVLSRSSVLLAPYRNVTESGTINLALTAGAGVIAYDGGVLGEYLPPASLVPTGDLDGFADRCVLALTDPDQRRAITVELPEARAVLDDWRAALRPSTERNIR